MPTKPNRAGQQQNYVPAGNGDASGEYGDNATGSNIHFTNFKKPEGEIVGTQTEGKTFGSFKKSEETKEEIKEQPKQSKPKIEDNLSSKFTGNDKEVINETVKKVVDDSNKEGLDIINDYLSQNEMLIQKSLKTVMHGKTTIAIAHRLSTLRNMDRIIVLDKGKIVESGTHAQLLHMNGAYRKLWNMQTGGFVGE